MPGVKHRAVRFQVERLLDNVGAKKEVLSIAGSLAMAKLRADLATFEDTWSEMAMRNLMADLVRDVGKLRAAAPVALQALCSEVERTLDTLMRGHSPSRARYDNVVCLGYRVKTVGDAYSGATSDWADMKARCDDLITSIRNAHQLVSANGNHNNDPKMLKVFMAPEFFFRGKNGAYEHSVVTGTQMRRQDGAPPVPARPGLIELMRAEIDRPAYKDWLFVLGTAIAVTKLSTTVCAVCNGAVQFQADPTRPGKTRPVCTANNAHIGSKEEVEGAMVDNVAIVMKEGTTFTVTKELVSHIDFVKDKVANVKNVVELRNEQLSVLRSPQGSGYTAASNVPPKFQDERMGGSIFTVDGVTFGLEVCLDHAAKPSDSAKGRLDHAANIQIQLIPSGGMGIGALSTVSGGIVFNVDGLTPHVQVVAGGPKASIRYDELIGTTEVQREYPRKITFENVPPLDELQNAKPLHKWKALPSAPKMASGPSGSVLMYGPYAIPTP